MPLTPREIDKIAEKTAEIVLSRILRVMGEPETLSKKEVLELTGWELKTLYNKTSQYNIGHYRGRYNRQDVLDVMEGVKR